MFARYLSVTIVVSLLPAAGLAQPAGEEAVVTMAVARAVSTYERFTVFDDVTLQVDGRAVTLRGKVTMPYKRDEIGRRAEAAAPGFVVSNEIEVLPASIRDDELRRKIARAIYSHPAFWRQAAMPNPPIHIVVERGRVTLTGVVSSEVDRSLARSLATGHGELSLHTTLKTDAEVRAELLARSQRAALRN
jgi:hyperosmotically inducible protein